MRHSATRSLLERDDVLIVASVSCIYGLGSVEAYSKMTLTLQKNYDYNREKIIKSLRYGIGFGVVAGFIQGLIASSYLYDGLILEAETQNLIAEYNPVAFVSIVSLSTAFFSILNSLNLKKILDSNFEVFGVL